MAITSNAQAISEINATNLTDGQQIKQLLADLVAYLGTGGAVVTPQAGPTELTAVGTASTTALVDVTATPTQAAINNNFASLNTLVNTLMTKLVAAGVLTSV
jgi:hypothetical protein